MDEDKFKRIVKWSAIGIAAAYVSMTACETQKAWSHPPQPIITENRLAYEGQIPGFMHKSYEALPEQPESSCYRYNLQYEH